MSDIMGDRTSFKYGDEPDAEADQSSPLDDLILMHDEQAKIESRIAAKFRFVDAVIEYVGDESRRDQVLDLMSTIGSSSANLIDRQAAASEVNTIMIESAQSNVIHFQEFPFQKRYGVAMAVQELTRDLNHSVATTYAENEGDFFQKVATKETSLLDMINLELECGNLVHLGDTEHANNERTQKWLGSPGNLQSLAEAGVRHIFVERSIVFQDIADDLAAGHITKSDFISRMLEANAGNAYRTDVNQELSELASVILNARSAGIRVHFADPWVSVSQIDEDLHLVSDKTLPMETRDSAAQRVVENYVSGLGEAIREFAEFRVALHLNSSTTNLERVREISVFESRQADLRTRYDSDLSEYIRAVLESEEDKGILWYGSGHGSYSNNVDIDGHLERSGIRYSRIDVYSDNSSFDANHISYYDPEKSDAPSGVFVFQSNSSEFEGDIYTPVGSDSSERTPALHSVLADYSPKGL